METLEKARVLHGDCLDVLKTLADNSVDSIVTDPPYGLSFMGKKWDYDVPSVEIWAECLRVLKPGGHLLAFAGTRTQHRMAVRIEDAGFEIRDMIAWVYGSGFPKSHNVSIAIDKINGLPHRGKALVVAGRGERKDIQGKDANPKPQDIESYAPATEAARHWQGWGTALKPALEPITVARKPLIGTVAENVLAHGTGGLNIDGCRVGNEIIVTTNGKGFKGSFEGGENNNGGAIREGRWPANLIHDGGEPAELLGDAARFFYCAKASKKDRDEGLDGFEARAANSSYGNGLNTATKIRTDEQAENGVSRDPRKNNHPTVKPTDLMRYLCRLVTPPSGIVLDPFTGSGSTGKAAVIEGFQFIGIEREAEYVEIARARISALDILNNK
jgi:site-specific DNA-methyltransferase (adenine-specific)